jgi:hypothetical protein
MTGLYGKLGITFATLAVLSAIPACATVAYTDPGGRGRPSRWLDRQSGFKLHGHFADHG